jgi:hypothetical protein
MYELSYSFYIILLLMCSDCMSFFSQLPNRLGKMLAPLHWQDYKKQYGKLDDFVSSHPEVHFHVANLQYAKCLLLVLLRCQLFL